MKTVVSGDVALLFDLLHWGNVTRRENNLNRSKKRMPLVVPIPEVSSHSSTPCKSCSYSLIARLFGPAKHRTEQINSPQT